MPAYLDNKKPVIENDDEGGNNLNSLKNTIRVQSIQRQRVEEIENYVMDKSVLFYRESNLYEISRLDLIN